MALSAFTDASRRPGDADVAAMLGAARSPWARVLSRAAALAAVEATWNHGGASVGWSMRLVDRGRVLAYLTPREGEFLFGVVVGEQVVARACAGRLAAPVRALLDAAPRYAEGRGVRFPVRTAADARVACRLLDLKVDGSGGAPRRRAASSSSRRRSRSARSSRQGTGGR